MLVVCRPHFDWPGSGLLSTTEKETSELKLVFFFPHLPIALLPTLEESSLKKKMLRNTSAKPEI